MLQNGRRRVLIWYRNLYGEESSLTKREKASCSVQAVMVTILFGTFFYRSITASFFMTPAGLYFLTMSGRRKEKEKRQRLRNEFKEAILSVAANLRAGYAVENAFRETLQEMKMLYGKETVIYQELYKIVQGLANQISIETLMGQFAKRAKLSEIQEFADIFAIAKKSGGNLTEIIYETAGTISEKIAVEKEIQVLTAAKRLEQNVMSMIPFAIVLYVGTTSPGYFDVLYTTVSGKAVMTVCLGIYMAAYMLGVKITEIQV